MTDLEKLKRKLSRIENKIDNLKEELENMPKRCKNKRSEKEEEIADLKADKRTLKREIRELEEELSNIPEPKAGKSRTKKSDNGEPSEERNLRRTITNEYFENGWSVRIYGDGHATAKKGSELKRADSESEILEIIQDDDVEKTSDSNKIKSKSAFTGESTGTIIDIDSGHQTYQTPAPWMGYNKFFDKEKGLMYDGAGHYTWTEYYANIYWINNLNGKRQSQEIRDKIKSEIGDARLTDKRLNAFLALNKGKQVDLVWVGGYWELADLDQLDYDFID
ncbi:MAG: hypothetical protein ACI4LT_03720 [Treponema sp.]